MEALIVCGLPGSEKGRVVMGGSSQQFQHRMTQASLHVPLVCVCVRQNEGGIALCVLSVIVSCT